MTTTELEAADEQTEEQWRAKLAAMTNRQLVDDLKAVVTSIDRIVERAASGHSQDYDLDSACSELTGAVDFVEELQKRFN